MGKATSTVPKRPYSVLSGVFKSSNKPAEKTLFFDRIDLTVLLEAYKLTHDKWDRLDDIGVKADFLQEVGHKIWTFVASFLGSDTQISDEFYDSWFDDFMFGKIDAQQALNRLFEYAEKRFDESVDLIRTSACCVGRKDKLVNVPMSACPLKRQEGKFIQGDLEEATCINTECGVKACERYKGIDDSELPNDVYVRCLKQPEEAVSANV